ncbi:MAG: HlyC/CorC family transporter [Candidatus Omnitrophica bacterium]|nr:HlyC/CorC family transporter [Candidatus Omnitrophota bacterium]
MALTLPLVLALAALLAASALCSATEAAILSVNKVRLRHLAEQGHHAAQQTYRLLAHVDQVIGTLLVANNLANIGLTALGSWVCINLFGPELGLLVATAVMTALVLLVGEVAPKTFAASHAETVIFAMVWPLRVLMVALGPIATTFTAAARWLLRLLRVPTKRRLALVTEEEIKVMIQMGREAGVLAEHELRLLQRIFEFSDSTVADAMIPRERIVGVNLASKAEEILDVLIEEGHSRIPVYRESLDQIVGVLYARDMLAMVRHGGLFALQDLIRPVAVVPPSKRIAELLSEFQRDKTQIAVVREGEGRTLGLVTIEDLLEEIVGEIHEEVPPKSS